jgi:hypothetical protein
MKALFLISLIVSILLPLAWFGFILFAFGGCVVFMVTCFGSALCALAFLLLVLSVIIMLPVNLIAVTRLWKQHRIFSLVPLILIILGPLAAISMTRPADYLCKTRFKRHLPRYKQVAATIQSNVTAEGHYKEFPSGWMRLSYIPPTAYHEDDGTLTIEFYAGVMPFPPQHIAYIYRSNGVIEKGSRTAKRWHNTTQVNECWFRVSD